MIFSAVQLIEYTSICWVTISNLVRWYTHKIFFWNVIKHLLQCLKKVASTCSTNLNCNIFLIIRSSLFLSSVVCKNEKHGSDYDYCVYMYALFDEFQQESCSSLWYQMVSTIPIEKKICSASLRQEKLRNIQIIHLNAVISLLSMHVLNKLRFICSCRTYV